jgi:hypothetical protein
MVFDTGQATVYQIRDRHRDQEVREPVSRPRAILPEVLPAPQQSGTSENEHSELH